MNTNPVRSREHLLHLLAEASELEHNLLCSYLYAAFSLKDSEDEDLTADELAAVRQWRATIMHVCMEEMSHLAQVANLMVAVGSRPHFDRPNLPVGAGYHPANIRIGLAPFCAATLDHFIILERPESSRLEDDRSLRSDETYQRQPEFGVLMPSAPDYETIGEFYELLSAGLQALAAEMGEERLFVGTSACQMRPQEIGAADLSVVVDVSSAVKAIELIIEQGEGAQSHAEASHFMVFRNIKSELAEMSARRPSFEAARNVARNPVMRRPITDDRVHVTEPAAAALLDAANAIYALMLRCLTAVYDTPSDSAARRRALLGCAIGLMKIVAELSGVLTRLPADASGTVNAGVTFAMLRATEGLAPGVNVADILCQRFERVIQQIPNLGLPAAILDRVTETLAGLRDTLAATA